MGYQLIASEILRARLRSWQARARPQRTPQGRFSELAAQYELRHAGAIQRYLASRAGLLSLLLQARGQLERYFPKASYSLRLVRDPDVADESYLAVYVASPLPNMQALKKLAAFEDEWWCIADRVGGIDTC